LQYISIYWHVRELLGMSTLKEGAVGAVGDWSSQERTSHKKTSQEEPLGRKEWQNTVRLFRTNSLKEGAV
jgi:hypothetical protein